MPLELLFLMERTLWTESADQRTVLAKSLHAAHYGQLPIEYVLRETRTEMKHF